MESKLLFNPFTRIAGTKSLIVGLIALLITSFLAYLTGTHFYGFYIINAKNSDFWVYLVENISNWLFISVFLFVSGLIFSKSKIRAIDIFGTTLLSMIPLIIVPVVRLIPGLQTFATQSFARYAFGLVSIIAVIWTISLLFNAYKVSSNLKNEKLIISFIVCLVLALLGTQMFLRLVIYKI